MFLEFTLPSGVATVINTDQIVTIAKDQDTTRRKDSLLEYVVTLSNGTVIDLTKEDYEGLCTVVGATDLAAIANGKFMDKIVNR